MRVTDRFVGPSSQRYVINFNTFVGNAMGGVIVDGGGYVGSLDASRSTTGGPRSGPGNVAVRSTVNSVADHVPGPFVSRRSPPTMAR